MARRSILASRTSRMALPASDSPEWEVISPGVRLGYRRGRGSYGRGGTWLAGSRNSAGKRIQARLGRADDRAAADGSAVLTHVKPFPATTASRVRFLATNEQWKLLGVATGDLRDLVAAALMTGARFGELARLRVRDFDPTNGSVFIAESKSGKARHIPLTAGGLAFFTRHYAHLAPSYVADVIRSTAPDLA